MNSEKLSRYFFIFLLLIIIYLSYLVLRPYITFAIFGMIFAFAFYPLYKRLHKRFKSDTVCAWITLIFVILLIILPATYIVFNLVQETSKAVEAFNADSLTGISLKLSDIIGQDVDLNSYANEFASDLKEWVLFYGVELLGKVASILIGLFIMFFIMFYGLKGGKDLIAEFLSLIPLKNKYKEKLMLEIQNMIQAVLYGQITTAIIQGALGGIALFIFGVPNPIFWGFIMIICAFIPFLGTPLVFVPASIYLFTVGNNFGGIGLLAFGFLVLINIDNFLRPILIQSKAKVHPTVALVGVLGGLSAFGLIGLILGPLILALLLVLLRFYSEDFQNQK